MYLEQSKNGYLWFVKQLDEKEETKIIKVYTDKDVAKAYIMSNKKVKK